MEQKILTAALNSANDCKLIEESLDRESLSAEGQVIFNEAVAFYAADPSATKVDRELLIKKLERVGKSEKVVKFLVNAVKALPTDVSSPNVLKELKEHRLHDLGSRLAKLLLSPDGSTDVASLMESYQAVLAGDSADKGVGEEQWTNTSLTSLVKTKFDKSQLIQLWPPQLSDMLDGGAKRGHHILIFAPTEMGKTLKAVNLTAGFLKQNLRVDYFCNEEPPADLLMRAASRVTGMDKYAILESPEKADEILANRNWKNLTLYSMAPGTFARINSIVRSDKPDVVVLDQLRNIDVRGAGNRTESLERAATEARNLARRHNVLVVSVSQAADSASGKRVLNRGDVDSSNVGIPGQCDLMIGIGADEQMERENLRVLSFPKNKLSGRHDPMPIQIDPLLSKVL